MDAAPEAAINNHPLFRARAVFSLPAFFPSTVMINWFVKKVLGSKNQREVRKLLPLVARINALEQEYQGLMEEQLIAKTTQLKDRVQNKGETLDSILPEAFAVVKNACRRLTERKHQAIVRGQPVTWEMIPFDVQLIGGMVLPFRPHRGNGHRRRQDARRDVPRLS